MNAVVVGPGVLIPPAVASAIAPVLTRALADARRRREHLDSEVVAAIELLERVGRHHRTRAHVPQPVPAGMPQHRPRETFDGVNTTTAARLLGITERAVRARLERGTLAGERTPNGCWLVFLDDTDERVTR